MGKMNHDVSRIQLRHRHNSGSRLPRKIFLLASRRRNEVINKFTINPLSWQNTGEARSDAGERQGKARPAHWKVASREGEDNKLGENTQ